MRYPAWASSPDYLRSKWHVLCIYVRRQTLRTAVSFWGQTVRIQSSCPQNGTEVLYGLTLLEPQSRFGDKPLKFRVVCPKSGTAVLKGLRDRRTESIRRGIWVDGIYLLVSLGF